MLKRKSKVERIIRAGDSHALKSYLQKHPDALEKTYAGDVHGSLLHIAAYYNQPAIISLLVLEFGMNIDARQRKDWVPLHHAARAGAWEAAQRLIELGANPYLKNAYGDIPLEDYHKNHSGFSFPDPAFDAIRAGDLDKLKEIAEKYPKCLDVNFSWSPKPRVSYRGNLLHVAASFNQPEIIEYLVKEKALGVNEQNEVSGRTPLHRASEEECLEATSALLQLGADPALQCRDGDVYTVVPAGGKTQKLLQDYQSQRTQRESAVKTKGAWTVLSAEEAMHERELPGGRYRLTRIFSFAAETWTSITENLQNGQIAQETKPLSGISKAEIEEARAILAETYNGAAEKADAPVPAQAPKQETKTEPQPRNYDHLKRFGQ
jgi:hypothetical protein